MLKTNAQVFYVYLIGHQKGELCLEQWKFSLFDILAENEQKSTYVRVV